MATVLFAASVTHAQNPPNFEAEAWVGWSTGSGVGNVVSGANPPITAVQDSRVVCTPFAQHGFARATVGNGTGSMHIISDICGPPNVGSRERSRVRLLWGDLIFTGPYPTGTLFTFDWNFEYAYQRTLFTGAEGHANSKLLLNWTNGPPFELPPTGGVMTPTSVTFTQRINNKADHMFNFLLENGVGDGDDSAVGDASFRLRPPTAGPAFTNFTLADVTVNSAQANIVNNFWILPTDIVIDSNTTQESLDQLVTVDDNVLMIAVPAVTNLSIPNLDGVGTAPDSEAGVGVLDNPDLTGVEVPLLTAVGSNLNISGNPFLDLVNLPALTESGGDVILTDNISATAITLPVFTTAGGDVTVTGNSSASSVDVGGLSSAGGDVTISGNGAASSVDVGGLSSAGGSVTIRGNGAASSVDVGSLATTGGDLIITDNISATAISLPLFTTAGGSVNVSGNTSAGSVSLDGLASTGGDVNVSGNTSAGSVSLGGLTSVGAHLTLVDNPLATDISLSSLTSVGGNLTLETQGQSVVDLSQASVAGNTDLTSLGADIVSAQTAAGTTDVTIINGAATMTAKLPAGAFTQPVPFTLTETNPAALPPQLGVDALGQTANVDPVAAYQFDFTVPTLNQHAALLFSIDVPALPVAARPDLLAAMASGSATLAVQGDAAGDPFVALPVCAKGQTPVTDGCVDVLSLDSNGFTVPPGHPATATIRFSGIADHFSTWALITVRLHGIGAFVDCFGGPTDAPDPTSPTSTEQCTYSFDVDGDDVVDLSDFAPFQVAFAGE